MDNCIYTKASSGDSNGELCLIVPPFYIYQVPLAYENDSWSKVKLGLYLSYTNTVTENYDWPLGISPISYGAGEGNYSFIGLGIGNSNPQPPRYADNTGFMGIAFDGFHDLGTRGEHPNTFGLIQNGDTVKQMLYTTSMNSIVLTESANDYPFYLPFNYMHLDYWYGGYIGLEFTVINRGLSSQQIKMEGRVKSSDGNWTNMNITDYSLSALELQTRFDEPIQDEDSNYAITEWNDGLSAYPLPDSFFFYNNWPNYRPRIHAWVAIMYA